VIGREWLWIAGRSFGEISNDGFAVFSLGTICELYE
jgi:hypothetical protein